MLLEILLLTIPIIANIGFFNTKLLKALSLASASLELIISFLLYFEIPVKGIFFIDNVTIYFLFIISSIYLLSVVYSLKYIEAEEIRGLVSEKLYYVLLNFFVSSMVFSTIINDYGLMWTGVELTTVASALLITTEYSEISLEAAWRYIIIVSAGVTIALFSIILIYYEYHTLTVTEILSSQPKDNLIIKLAVALALIGFGTKVGVFPMYTWLPDAHSESPSPISALFSASLLPVAMYVLYRVYEIYPLTDLFVVLPTLSIITASIILFKQWHIKRMFAYSTIENMNLALIGLATGQVFGAIILLLAHAFGKAAAFYSSGVIIKTFHEKKIDEINGLYRMKITSSSLLLSSMAVTGTPPFGTFIGEFLILKTLIQSGYIIEFILLVIFLALIFISINYNVSRMIFSQPKHDRSPKEPLLMSLVSLISSIISLGIGIILIIRGVVG
ncbi:MAG: hydrogenase 4 subunit F [Sulfolobus sp.]|jgi:hydrogenase-4 component F|nr:hydrogenase 4 subunit F [Sulfolobus sp.]